MVPVDSRDYVLSGIYYSALVRNTCQTLPANTMLTQWWSNAGSPSATLAQQQPSTGSTPRVCWAAFNPVNTKHLYNVVQILYKCFVVVGNRSWSGIAYCWRRLQANTDSMFVKCWASVAGAGQYPSSLSQYFILPVPACWRYGQNAEPKLDYWRTFSVHQTRHGNPTLG